MIGIDSEALAVDPERGESEINTMVLQSNQTANGPVDNDSEEEDVQITRKRSKKMIIDDDDSGDDVVDNMTNHGDGEQDDSEAHTLARSSGSATEKSRKIPESHPHGGKKTAEQVLAAVLDGSQSDEDAEERKTSDMDVDGAEGSSNTSGDESSDDASERKSPVKLSSDLYDAEDSSDEDQDVNLDAAAGPEYDSAEDKDFEESAIDPKLLKKLKKMKGAAKKPREQKSRKCKPTKDDMLELHSESQRLMRESHVNLPYHKPAPKSLQDFMERAKRKHEAYRSLRGARDIEKAQVIQDKIAESSVVKLPQLRHTQRASKKTKSHSASQQQQDSDHVLDGPDHRVNCQDSQVAADANGLPSPGNAGQGSGDWDQGSMDDDYLPDLAVSVPDGSCDSQPTVAEQGSVHNSQDYSQESVATLKSDSQRLEVEEFDSPPSSQHSQPSLPQSQTIENVESLSLNGEHSQTIEDVESLSITDCNSQRSEAGLEAVPDSLECDKDVQGDSLESDMAIAQAHSLECENTVEPDSLECATEASCENTAEELDLQDCDSGVERDVGAAGKEEKKTPDHQSGCEEPGAEESIADGQRKTTSGDTEAKAVAHPLSLAKAVAVRAVMEKGVQPTLGRGGGDFVVLDDRGEQSSARSKGVQDLMQRLVAQRRKKARRQPTDVQISIIEKTGEEGQEKDLKLSTVKYHVNGDDDLDFTDQEGRGLDALKRRLQAGMAKRRAAAYEKRQQLYKMENEEGYEDDQLPDHEDEAEMTDPSDTDDEAENDIAMAAEKERGWNPFVDDEAEDDDDDDYDEDDSAPQQAVCAEIDDRADDDEDLFQDSEQLQLHLDISDDEDGSDDDYRADDDKERKDEEEEKEDEDEAVSVRRPRGSSQRLAASDDDDDDDLIQPGQASSRSYKDDPYESGSDRLQSAQDTSKFAEKNKPEYRHQLDLSFELTPMTRLLQDTQPSPYSRRSGLLQPIEDSQDLYGGSESDLNSSTFHTSFSDEPVSQILDADGFIKIPTTQPRRSAVASSLLMEGSHDAEDGTGMNELMGLCSGQFAGGPRGSSPKSEGFSGLFCEDKSQDDHSSINSLFDSSHSNSQRFPSYLAKGSQGQGDMGDVLGLCSGQFKSATQPSDLTLTKGSQGQGDMADILGLCSGQFKSAAQPNDLTLAKSSQGQSDMSDVLGLCSGQFKSASQSSDLTLTKGSQGQGDMSDVLGLCSGQFKSTSQPSNLTLTKGSQGQGDMADVLGLCSGQFKPAAGSASQSQTKSQSQSQCGVKRRLIVTDDSSDEEGENTGPFLLLSDDERTKDSDKNELSDSDEEKDKIDEVGDDDDNDGDNEDTFQSEPVTSFKGFKNKKQMLRQFVEDEAELSGSEAESDEDLDLAEEDDYLEVEAGDKDVALDEEQLRDQVGRVHMKQILDDDDRELMRYKEMYLPDGDLHSEGAGRLRRFHWKNMGEEESLPDMFADGSDEEKEKAEDPDEKLWRMQRYEREKFLQSQQVEVAEEAEDEDNCQFLKLGKVFMKRQTSDPTALPIKPKAPMLMRPSLKRSQSLVEKASPAKFAKPKVPKRGSFLGRSKDSLARIAEITRGSGVKVGGTKKARGFVFSVADSNKDDSNDTDQFLNKTEGVTPAAPAVETIAAPKPAVKRVAHKPPAKKICLDPQRAPKTKNSIFKHFDK